MSILDKAPRYDLNSESCYYCSAHMENVSDGDFIRTDDPVLAALVEYYEAMEEWEAAFLNDPHLLDQREEVRASDPGVTGESKWWGGHGYALDQLKAKIEALP